jgi:twitching motility protein PilJ
MNSSMDAIRERNLDISEYSESTQKGVSSLNASMRDVADSLSQFKIEEISEAERTMAAIEDLKKIQSARKVYREDEMKALEETQLSRASV